MTSQANLRYFLTTLGAVLTVISGILVLLAIFIAGIGGVASLIFFNPAGLAIIGGSLVLAIIPIIWIVLAVIIYNAGHKHRSRGKFENGVLIIVLSIIILFLGGGFVIGPILSGIGGFLLIL
ncbi:MAG: hypothetical protein AMDU5_GPLC00012G0080 [Thermoplasmatales archaeon Gpl]|jgi:hypothetical protein|nr:MAG: hypothetical protein AMDU5_GPLC00012G0080 [Thermoplasmatales archaeon Gpl]